MPENLVNNANKLIQKIRHFLITNLGKVQNEASIEEFYIAFCFALREEIMVNWTTTTHSFEEANAKSVYFLSMEYMPGKFLGNNITNLGIRDLIQIVLKKMGRNLKELIEYETDPGLGNGGLGRLASCFLDSLATLQFPSMAYGLRYQYGIFEQELYNGVQVERPDCWLLHENPWEFRKDSQSQLVHFSGKIISGTNIHGDEILQLEDYQEVRALPYDMPIIGFPHDNGNFSVITLRLWSTKESPRNFELQRYNAGEIGSATENSSLTDVLYPNDNTELGKRIRLKQEFLLASSSVQDILNRHIRIHGNIEQIKEKVQIQINETHAALTVVELVRKLNKNFDIPFNKAWEMTQAMCNYTNHTIMKEALEEWNEHRLAELLPRQYRVIQKLNNMLCAEARKKFPNDERKIQRMSIFEKDQIKMANLAVFGSKKVNGVAKLHADILKQNIFKDFNDLYPDKIIPITNGVTPRRWLLHCNPPLADWISSKIGKNWIFHFPEIEKLTQFADPSSTADFLDIKKTNKELLFKFVSQFNPIRDMRGRIISHLQAFDPCDVLVDVMVKRFHEYKRQLLLALHLIILYNELKENISSRKIKRFVVIGGKAAPGYAMAKNILLLCFAVAKKINADPEVSSKLKVSIIENYNVSKAEIIMPAADLSEQISLAGMEASGTGNMKLSMNGSLTIGTNDGANIEMKEAVTEKYWPFSFGLSAEEVKNLRENRDSYRPFDFSNNYPYMQKALEKLKNNFFAENNFETQAFQDIYNSLILNDYFFILKDLAAYYETQKRVEELFLNKDKWVETAIHNIAGMGNFSSDEVIKQYASKVWDLKTCPLNKTILSKVKKEFAENII